MSCEKWAIARHLSGILSSNDIIYGEFVLRYFSKKLIWLVGGRTVLTALVAANSA